MTSTLAERIATILDESSIQPSALARFAGVSASAVTQWKDGTAASIGARAAYAIEDRLRFSARWVMFGEGPKRIEKNVTSEEVRIPVQAMRTVPVVGTTQAGPPDRIWLETEHPPGAGDTLLQIATVDEHAYALRVIGNSMAPRVLEGDFVVLAPSFEPRPGCDVVVRTVHGDVMLKRLEARRGTEVVLASVNEAFERRILPAHEIEIMHRVAAYVPADMADMVARSVTRISND